MIRLVTIEASLGDLIIVFQHMKECPRKDTSNLLPLLSFQEKVQWIW